MQRFCPLYWYFPSLFFQSFNISTWVFSCFCPSYFCFASESSASWFPACSDYNADADADANSDSDADADADTDADTDTDADADADANTDADADPYPDADTVDVYDVTSADADDYGDGGECW